MGNDGGTCACACDSSMTSEGWLDWIGIGLYDLTYGRSKSCDDAKEVGRNVINITKVIAIYAALVCVQYYYTGLHILHTGSGGSWLWHCHIRRV